jgi:hypothetical protein
VDPDPGGPKTWLDPVDPDPQHCNFIFQPLFQSAQHFFEKREGSGAGSAYGSVLVTNGSGCGSGTLPDWHQNDADPHEDHTSSFTHYFLYYSQLRKFLQILVSFLIKGKCVMILSTVFGKNS